MFWSQRKRLRAFAKSSLWIVPVYAMLLAMICAPVTRYLDGRLHFRLLAFGLQGARAAVAMIAASMLSFVVFFFSVLLLTVQIASGTLSPRIIARPFQSRILKASLGLFVFTFVYGLSVLGRLEDEVLQLPVSLTLLLSVASIGIFLFIVERIGKELRPAAVVTAVAQQGLEVIRNVYPLPCARGTGAQQSAALPKGSVCRSIHHEGRSGVVVAFDLNRLVRLAIAHQCVIELVPQVGDFVASGAPLFRVHGGSYRVPARKLRDSIVLGQERTMEQDPAFAFRIIVDIAEKALSPAINDPTTGVLAIDQLQYLLQEVGERNLSTGVASDDSGRIRVTYRTPNWEDFVSLTVAEIRHYGSSSVQITRRLRSMLEYLMSVLPPERAPLLQEQLDILHAGVEMAFIDPWDRALADVADSQGLGGSLKHGGVDAG
jgi:uncharacterized membrane protein